MIVATLPVTPVLVHQFAHVLRLHVPGHDDGGVFRPVVAMEEFQTVVVLVGHVLNIFQETHGGVLISVVLKSGLVQYLVHLAARIRAVLVVFAKHCQRLRLELGFRILQVLKAVGLHQHHLLEILFGEGGMVNREVVAGGCVGCRAGAFQHGRVFLGRKLLSAAKHQVLEQVREAGVAGFDLIAGAGLDHDNQRHHVGVVGRNGDQAQAVGQVFLREIEWKDIVRPGAQDRRACHHKAEKDLVEHHSHLNRARELAVS